MIENILEFKEIIFKKQDKSMRENLIDFISNLESPNPIIFLKDINFWTLYAFDQEKPKVIYFENAIFVEDNFLPHYKAYRVDFIKRVIFIFDFFPGQKEAN